MIICIWLVIASLVMANECNAYGILTPLLTRNNILCSAEVVQSQGRYYCDQDFNIRCVPGWRNESMLCAIAICPEDCNEDKKQGQCLRPGICACSLGWRGLSCNECIPRQGCVRGTCQRPGECNCQKNFHGPFCNSIFFENNFKTNAIGINLNQDMERQESSKKEGNGHNTSSQDEDSSTNILDTLSPINVSFASRNPSNYLPSRYWLSRNVDTLMSESHSTNKSSSEDFTAPPRRRKKVKNILNSTEYFNHDDSTPSTLPYTTEEDSATINELERNIDSTIASDISKLDSNPFAPRFRGSDSAYYEYSLEEEENESTTHTDSKQKSYVHSKPSQKTTTTSRNFFSRSSDLLSGNKSKKSIADNDRTAIQTSISEENNEATTTLLYANLSIRPNTTQQQRQSTNSKEHESTRKYQTRSYSARKSTLPTNNIESATFKSSPLPLRNIRNSTSTASEANSTPLAPKGNKGNSSTEDSMEDSLSQLDSTIDKISSLKKDIHSIDQQLNLTYIEQLLNASISLRNLGFRHCQNRISDVGHPYHNDRPIIASGSPEEIYCNPGYPYYSLDGSCNSISNPSRGMAFTPFRRVVKPIDLEENDFRLAMNFEEDGLLCKRRLEIFNQQNGRYAPLVRSFVSFVALDMAQCLGVVQKPLNHQSTSNHSLNGKCPSHFEEETVNRITAFIDGSQIYGNTFHESMNKRTGSDGLLIISKEEKKDFYLQLSSEESMSVELIITLFKLEHNRLAGLIKEAYKNNYELFLGKRENEVIFQESRRIILALIQHIIYDEFLPAVLGSNLYHRFELSSMKNTFYDRSLNPSIFSGFVTSFSHIFTDPCKTEEIEGASKENFRQDKPGILFEDHPHLIAIFSHLNNDHGYYKDFKQLCGTKDSAIEAEAWQKIVNIFKGNSSTIDLLSGGLMEQHVQGGLVGPTFACVIAYQFHLVKAGDRRFYSHVRQGYPAHLDTKTDSTLIRSLQMSKPKFKKSFTRIKEPKYYNEDPNINSVRDSYRFNYDEIDEIRTRTMSGLFCSNALISQIPSSPFYVVDKKWNTLINCDSIAPFNVRTFIDSSNSYFLKKK